MGRRSAWLVGLIFLTCASSMLFFGGANGCRLGGSSSVSSTNPSEGDDSSPGEEGEIEGLEIASQISLVEAQGGAAALTSDISTPYYTDPLEVHVYDPSMEPLRIVNEILCMIGQTHYAEMVNQGPYIALVNNSLCSNDRSSETGNPSSGANAEDLETWIVDSTRASADAEQIVSFWIDEEEGEFDDPMTIEARLTITEAKSDQHPFGIFHIDFAMKDPDTRVTWGQGYLESLARDDGRAEFQFGMQEAGNSWDRGESVHAVMNADGSSGFATLSHNCDGSEGESGTFEIAYDENHYQAVRTTTGEERCLSRRDYDNFVFRYGVYDDNGARVELENPGFGIKYGNNVYGFAGYYGLWLPKEFDLVSGLTVRRSNNDGNQATYTTVVVPGKLARHTREEISLREVRDAPLSYWENETVYRVVWDGTSLVKTAIQSCPVDNPCTWTDITETPLALEPGMWAGFWRDGTGSLFLRIPENGLSDQTTLTLDRNTILTAEADEFASGPLTLYCAHQCLKPAITEAMMNWDDASPYWDGVMDPSEAYAYTINPADMALRYNGDPIEVEEGVSVSEGPYRWGIQSGPLVLSTAGIEDVWDFWDQPVHYTWETGTNPWNRYTGLIDSDGRAVVFDPPLRLDYKHPNGLRYTLEHNGFGELSGIPWQKEEGTNRWYPTVTVVDGTTVTSEDGTPYYIRSLEMEQRMREVDSAFCNGLEGESLSLPDGDFSDPAIGPKPIVAADPAVIGGKLMIP